MDRSHFRARAPGVVNQGRTEMGTRPDAPADTTMMRIVHDALRRDLARAHAALADPEDLDGARRRAIAAHLGWMMRFLHAHHASEDDGLYPFVRSRAREDSDLEVLDRMGRDHESVAVAIAGVEQTAADLAANDSREPAERVVAALEALDEVLLPHLRDEENVAMPLVSELITNAEWQALEKAHNLDGKPRTDLAFEGHWLIDGATEADRAAVVELVPPIPRFLLLHGYARRYRRHAAACWGDPTPPRRVQVQNRVEVTVDASINDVWDVVRDITRVGEWSHECVGAEWMGEARSAVPGARFRGRNRSGPFRWGRICEIVSAEPYELVWRTVPTALFPDSSEWRITLADAGGRTTITQSFRVLRAPKMLSVLFAILVPAHRDRTAGLIADLVRLGGVATLATNEVH